LGRACSWIIKKTIADTRERMFLLALDLWRAFLDHFVISEQPVEDFVRILNDDALPELIAKTSDQNPRIKQDAIEFIPWLAKFHSSFTATVYTFILQPLKNPAASRLFRAKLELITTLLPNFQLSDTDVYLEPIILLAVSATEHNHSEVREAAVALLRHVYAIVGSRIFHFTLKAKSSHIDVSYGGIFPDLIIATFRLVTYQRRTACQIYKFGSISRINFY
jgi:hypothetical protein